MNKPVPSGFLNKLFWTPVACLLGVEIYVRNFGGWGAWATAPLFLIPLALSGAIAGAGIVQCVLECRAKALRTTSIVFSGVAVVPWLWLLVRRFVL